MGELRGGVGWAGDMFFFVTDGQQRNYLKSCLAAARGATNNGFSIPKSLRKTHMPALTIG